MEQTLIIIKPDAIQRGIAGEILHRFEKKGLKFVALKMMRLDDAILNEHYAHVSDAPFFEELAHFMSSSPVIVGVLEGLNAVKVVRFLAGVKNTDLGSIRGDYAISSQRNIIHSSDSVENAENEIKRFFEKSEILDYEKDEWKHTISEKERNS